MDSGGAKGTAIMSEKENKSKEKDTSASPVEPVQEAASSTLENQQGAAKKSRADSTREASPVEPVQEGAPAPSSTLVNQQGDLAMDPAEISRVDSAVASPPSSIGGGSAACAMSVVTVGATRFAHATSYGTGFIIISEENYSVIFSSLPSYASENKQTTSDYHVYFENGSNMVEAMQLYVDDDHMFTILLAETDKKYPAVSFRNDPPGREMVFTVGTMSGTKLHAKSRQVINELIGCLGTYNGEVITPICDAVDFDDVPESGSEMFFEVTCNVHDDIVDLPDIDNDRAQYKSVSVSSAPVFSLSNEVIGLIYSHGTWHDVKVGLLSKYIIRMIKKMCGYDDWKDELKKSAERNLSRGGERRKRGKKGDRKKKGG